MFKQVFKTVIKSLNHIPAGEVGGGVILPHPVGFFYIAQKSIGLMLWKFSDFS